MRIKCRPDCKGRVVGLIGDNRVYRICKGCGQLLEELDKNGEPIDESPKPLEDPESEVSLVQVEVS